MGAGVVIGSHPLPSNPQSIPDPSLLLVVSSPSSSVVSTTSMLTVVVSGSIVLPLPKKSTPLPGSKGSSSSVGDRVGTTSEPVVVSRKTSYPLPVPSSSSLVGGSVRLSVALVVDNSDTGSTTQVPPLKQTWSPEHTNGSKLVSTSPTVAHTAKVAYTNTDLNNDLLMIMI